jgi:hypothetical protein
MGQVTDRIEQYAEEIRAAGTEGDRLMCLADTSARRLRESGAIRMLQPKTYGGLECHPREFAETTMAIAAMDGAAGWVTGIVGVHPWELAFADPRVQEEIWGTDPDTWVASPYAPMGVATPVDGGAPRPRRHGARSARWTRSSPGPVAGRGTTGSPCNGSSATRMPAWRTRSMCPAPSSMPRR